MLWVSQTPPPPRSPRLWTAMLFRERTTLTNRHDVYLPFSSLCSSRLVGSYKILAKDLRARYNLVTSSALFRVAALRPWSPNTIFSTRPLSLSLSERRLYNEAQFRALPPPPLYRQNLVKCNSRYIMLRLTASPNLYIILKTCVCDCNFLCIRAPFPKLITSVHLPGSPMYIKWRYKLVFLYDCRTPSEHLNPSARQPVDNRRVSADFKFIGNSEVVVASGCQRSPLFLSCRRSATGLYLCATEA